MEYNNQVDNRPFGAHGDQDDESYGQNPYPNFDRQPSGNVYNVGNERPQFGAQHSGSNNNLSRGNSQNYGGSQQQFQGYNGNNQGGSYNRGNSYEQNYPQEQQFGRNESNEQQFQYQGGRDEQEFGGVGMENDEQRMQRVMAGGPPQGGGDMAMPNMDQLRQIGGLVGGLSGGGGQGQGGPNMMGQMIAMGGMVAQAREGATINNNQVNFRVPKIAHPLIKKLVGRKLPTSNYQQTCPICNQNAEIKVDSSFSYPQIGLSGLSCFLCWTCFWCPLIVDDFFDHKHICKNCGHTIVEEKFCFGVKQPEEQNYAQQQDDPYNHA